jgi:4,4'-diaponeurosporenoate glycosyltransferase
VSLLLPTLCTGGLAAGFLLLRRVPTIPETPSVETIAVDVSIIIPARDEEANLAVLLASLMGSELSPREVIVVDDCSTDDTNSVASSFGARVITLTSPEPEWRGKNWACHIGALAATSDTLLFLDADTQFSSCGLRRMMDYFHNSPPNTALSVLPFHVMHKPYEELSLFFNLLMAIGAGGFGGLDRPHLFGQSLLIPRELYSRAGGHQAVRQHILENFHFSSLLRAVNGRPLAVSGRGTLFVRMFPNGLSQLRESWEKAFASGAGDTSVLVLFLSIYWLSAASTVFLIAVTGIGVTHAAGLVLYLAFAIQIAWLSRKIGSFRLSTAFLYPIPLVFYFVIFGRSMWLHHARRTITWKGRRI